MTIIKVVSIIILALFGIILVAFIVAGLTIPAERSFTNSIEINRPPDQIRQVLNDRARFAEWQLNLEKVEITDYQNWIEYPKDAPEPLKFHLSKDMGPSEMEFTYTMGNSFEGTWNGRVKTSENGSRLETTDSYKAKNWVTKILLYFFFDLDHFAKDWNGKLKQRVESL